MTFSYLASPYSNPDDPTDRQYCEQRFEEACIAAAKLMAKGELIFCPIAHSHPIADWLRDDLRTSHDFWLHQDFALLRQASKLYVLKLTGWLRSVGIQREIDFAQLKGIPIEYLDPDKI